MRDEFDAYVVLSSFYYEKDKWIELCGFTRNWRVYAFRGDYA